MTDAKAILEGLLELLPARRPLRPTQSPRTQMDNKAMTDEEIAAGLSEAQKAALLDCTPWDVCVGAGIAVAFCENGFLQDSTILDDGVELTPLGLRVRKILEKQ